MAETTDNTYATTAANAAAGAPNKVAVVNDGTGDRQIVGLGLLDGTTNLVDSTHGLPSILTDNTNTANVVAGDTAHNSVSTVGGVKTYSFTTSATGAQTLLADTDIRGYSIVEVVYTVTGAGINIAGQFAAAAAGTYVSAQTFFQGQGGGSTAASLGSSTGTIYYTVVHGNFFQLAISTMTSGTLTGTVTLRNMAPAYDTIKAVQSGAFTVGSNSATGSAFPANGFAQAVKALTASPAAATTGNLTALTGDVMGEALVTSGGLVTTSVPANASNVVVKGSAGRLCRVLVTTTGVTAMQIFDNATTNSGTIIGALPASAAIGGVYDFEMPAANGITIAGSATNPAVTVSWI